MIDPLLEAIDALIGPQKTVILQDGLKPITIIRPSLLEQLGAAVSASTGSPGGAHDSSPASQRNMLDSDAMYQFGLMTSQIKDWGRLRGITGRITPGVMLRRWYDAHILVDGHEDTFYTHKIWAWVRTIEAKMDPPKRLEITDACPTCGKDQWADHEGNVYKFPVIVQYRDDDASSLELAEAMCRACDNVWKGTQALRRLRWDIDVRNS